EQVEEHAREVETHEPREARRQPDRPEQQSPLQRRQGLTGRVEQYGRGERGQLRRAKASENGAEIGPVENEQVERDRDGGFQPPPEARAAGRHCSTITGLELMHGTEAVALRTRHQARAATPQSGSPELYDRGM